jgi:hypothetical protein
VIGQGQNIDSFGQPDEKAPSLGLGGLGLAHFAADGSHVHSLRAGHLTGFNFVVAGPENQAWVAGGFSRDLDLSFGLPNEDSSTMSVVSRYREINRGNVYIGHFRF